MARIYTDNLTRSIGTLELALDELGKHEPGEFIYDVFRSACIKEFEVIIELSASLLRRRLRPYFGTVRQVRDMTFARVFKEAARLHLISLDEVERWHDYREYRNDTAHQYGSQFAEAAIRILRPFIDDARRLAEMIGEETDE